MTFAELLVAEAEAVVDVATTDSAPSVILITVGAVWEADEVVEILELAAEVVVIELDVVEDDVADGVAEVVGSRNFESKLDASLGDTVVVVVEAAEGMTVTVTVTTWPDEVIVFEVDVVAGDEVEEVIVFEADVVAEDEVEEVVPDVDVELVTELDSEPDPVMPPVAPAALIRASTLLSLLQIRAWA